MDIVYNQSGSMTKLVRKTAYWHIATTWLICIVAMLDARQPSLLIY